MAMLDVMAHFGMGKTVDRGREVQVGRWSLTYSCASREFQQSDTELGCDGKDGSGKQDSAKEDNPKCWMVEEDYGESPCLMVSISDGHGKDGRMCAQAVADLVPRILKRTVAFATGAYDRALQAAIPQIDDALIWKEGVDTRRSGAGVTITMLSKEGDLHVGHLGLAKVLVGRADHTGWVTTDSLAPSHDAEDDVEAVRITQRGGQLTDVHGGLTRVYLPDDDARIATDGLEVARCMGATEFRAVGVHATPDICRYALDEQDKYLVVLSGVPATTLNEKLVMNKVHDMVVAESPVPLIAKKILELVCKSIENPVTASHATVLVCVITPKEGYDEGIASLMPDGLFQDTKASCTNSPITVSAMNGANGNTMMNATFDRKRSSLDQRGSLDRPRMNLGTRSSRSLDRSSRSSLERARSSLDQHQASSDRPRMNLGDRSSRSSLDRSSRSTLIRARSSLDQQQASSDRPRFNLGDRSSRSSLDRSSRSTLERSFSTLDRSLRSTTQEMQRDDPSFDKITITRTVAAFRRMASCNIAEQNAERGSRAIAAASRRAEKDPHISSCLSPRGERPAAATGGYMSPRGDKPAEYLAAYRKAEKEHKDMVHGPGKDNDKTNDVHAADEDDDQARRTTDSLVEDKPDFRVDVMALPITPTTPPFFQPKGRRSTIGGSTRAWVSSNKHKSPPKPPKMEITRRRTTSFTARQIQAAKALAIRIEADMSYSNGSNTRIPAASAGAIPAQPPKIEPKVVDTSAAPCVRPPVKTSSRSLLTAIGTSPWSKRPSPQAAHTTTAGAPLGSTGQPGAAVMFTSPVTSPAASSTPGAESSSNTPKSKPDPTQALAKSKPDPAQTLAKSKPDPAQTQTLAKSKPDPAQTLAKSKPNPAQTLAKSKPDPAQALEKSKPDPVETLLSLSLSDPALANSEPGAAQALAKRSSQADPPTTTPAAGSSQTLAATPATPSPPARQVQHTGPDADRPAGAPSSTPLALAQPDTPVALSDSATSTLVVASDSTTAAKVVTVENVTAAAHESLTPVQAPMGRRPKLSGLRTATIPNTPPPVVSPKSLDRRARRASIALAPKSSQGQQRKEEHKEGRKSFGDVVTSKTASPTNPSVGNPLRAHSRRGDSSEMMRIGAGSIRSVIASSLDPIYHRPRMESAMPTKPTTGSPNNLLQRAYSPSKPLALMPERKTPEPGIPADMPCKRPACK